MRGKKISAYFRRKIIKLLWEGVPSKDVAKKTGISEATVGRIKSKYVEEILFDREYYKVPISDNEHLLDIVFR